MVVILSSNSFLSYALFGLLMVCLRNGICHLFAREHAFKGPTVQNLDSWDLFLIESHLQVACLVKKKKKSNEDIMFHHDIIKIYSELTIVK